MSSSGKDSRISVERIVRKRGNMSQYILMGGDIGSLETIYLGKEVTIEIKVMFEE